SWSISFGAAPAAPWKCWPPAATAAPTSPGAASSRSVTCRESLDAASGRRWKIGPAFPPWPCSPTPATISSTALQSPRSSAGSRPAWKSWRHAGLRSSSPRSPSPALLERARELDERLRRLGREHGAQMVEPEASWYGIDPIHLRRSRRREVWERLTGVSESPAVDRPQARIPLLGAESLRLAGRALRTSQPAVRLPDGTSIALY